MALSIRYAAAGKQPGADFERVKSLKQNGGYPARAKLIADRVVYLAGYRMAELLERITRRMKCHPVPGLKNSPATQSRLQSH